MNLQLKRHLKTDAYTIGRLYINGTYFCDTLEDRMRNLPQEKKIPGETAIPAGRYKIVVNISPRFKRLLPRLSGVPGFEGILIHRGNTDKDTAGCILVGEYKQTGKLYNSTGYELRLTAMLEKVQAQGESISIEIL